MQIHCSDEAFSALPEVSPSRQDQDDSQLKTVHLVYQAVTVLAILLFLVSF